MSSSVTQNSYEQALVTISQVLNQSKYSPYIFPMTGTEYALNVTLEIYFFKLLSLMNNKVLTIAIEFDLKWYDPNVPGNWLTLPNSTVVIDSKWLFSLNLYLFNPATSDLYLRPTNLMYLDPPDGRKPGAMIHENIISEVSIVCDSMSLIEFPFDSQTCTMKAGYYDNAKVNFILPGYLEIFPNAGNGNWRLNNVTWANASDLNINGTQYGFAMQFSFTRNSYYYVVFLIVPTVLLQAIAMLTFVLPSDRGEKVMLGSTLILAVNVLLTSLNALIPQVEPDQVPNILTALKVGYIMTALSLFEGVLVQTLRIVASDLPDSVHRFVDQYVCCKAYTRTQSCKTKDQSQHSSSSLSSLSLSSNNKADFLHSHSTSTSTSTSSVNLVSVCNATSIYDCDHDHPGPGSKQLTQKANANTSSPLAHVCSCSCNCNCTCNRYKVDKPSSTCVPSLETVLVQMLEEHKQKEYKRKVVSRSWRKVEYALNFVTLIVYAIVMGYYFRQFIL